MANLPVDSDPAPLRIQKILERVSDMNEEGVYALADGDTSERAIDFFDGALRLLGEASRWNSSLAVVSDARCKDPRKSKNHTICYSLPHSLARQEVPYLQNIGGPFYTFSAAISITPKCATPSSEPFVCYAENEDGRAEREMDMVFYHAIISFNLALAYHQLSSSLNVSCRDSASASLERANDHYFQCQEALLALPTCLFLPVLDGNTSSTNKSYCCQDSRDVLVITLLAALNNQALILHLKDGHHVPQEESDSSVTRSALRQLLLTYSMDAMQRIKNKATNYSMFEQWQIQEFARNAVLLELGPCIAACGA